MTVRIANLEVSYREREYNGGVHKDIHVEIGGYTAFTVSNWTRSTKFTVGQAGVLPAGITLAELEVHVLKILAGIKEAQLIEADVNKPEEKKHEPT